MTRFSFSAKPSTLNLLDELEEDVYDLLCEKLLKDQEESSVLCDPACSNVLMNVDFDLSSSVFVECNILYADWYGLLNVTTLPVICWLSRLQTSAPKPWK